ADSGPRQRPARGLARANHHPERAQTTGALPYDGCPPHAARHDPPGGHSMANPRLYDPRDPPPPAVVWRPPHVPRRPRTYPGTRREPHRAADSERAASRRVHVWLGWAVHGRESAGAPLEFHPTTTPASPARPATGGWAILRPCRRGLAACRRQPHCP